MQQTKYIVAYILLVVFVVLGILSSLAEVYDLSMACMIAMVIILMFSAPPTK